jgi:RNA polymerase sigma factor (sigma-70 family)
MVTNSSWMAAPSSFPSTVWSDIAALRAGPSAGAALERLMRTYWKPVFAYIRAAWKCSTEDALDHTQAFFTHLLEKEHLQHIHHGEGTFRGYLKIAVKHFLLNRRRGERMREAVSLEASPADMASGETPEEAYDREWFQRLIDDALVELKTLLERAGKERHYEAFRAYCLDRTSEADDATYREIAERLSVTATDVRHCLSYCRSALREILRRQVREYAADGEVETELRRLLGRK